MVQAAGAATIAGLEGRAARLIARLGAEEPDALLRLRSLPQFRRADDAALREAVPGLTLAAGLAVLAAEFGFASWEACRRVLTEAGSFADFGDLLAFTRHDRHLNSWFARYEEAAAARGAAQPYLLAYRRQFLLCDRQYIRALGLEADDPDWAALGFDWVRPQDGAARPRLYARLIAALPADEAPHTVQARLRVRAIAAWHTGSR